MSLTQKPFHSLKFQNIYNNGESKVADFKRIKSMASGRKPKVYVTPELFDVIVSVYKSGGGIKEIVEATNISNASASKYLDKARKKVAQEKDEKKEDLALQSKLDAALKAGEELRRQYEKLAMEYNKVKTENATLKAKVDVLMELMRK